MNLIKNYLAILLTLIGYSKISYGQTNFSKPKVFAVIVGISDYKDSEIPNLKYPEKDAKAFYDFLRSPASGKVPEEQISFITATIATRENVIKETVRLFSRASKEDLLIFYFSGHAIGSAGEDRTGYFLSYDTQKGNEMVTAISMDEIQTKINRFNGKMKISYIDACHSGMLTKSGMKGLEEDNSAMIEAYNESLRRAGEGYVSFLSSQPNQQSQEDDKLGHGVFTYYLLKGLKGDADLEHQGTKDYKDGKVTIEELGTYLTNKVPMATKFSQKPLISGNYDLQFPLSVLRPDVLLASEMSNRPLPNKPSVNGPILASGKATDTKMPAALTHSGTFCYGQFTISNEFKEPILLYFLRAKDSSQPNLVLAPGAATTTSRLYCSFSRNSNDCIDAMQNATLFFKTIGDGPTLYGYIKTTIQGGLNKAMVLNKSTLYLSKQAPKSFSP